MYLEELPLEKKKQLIKWIKHNIKQSKKRNKYSSYILKHFAERAIDYYITNNQFKEAMLHCGFEPTNPMDLNWYFRINFKEEKNK